MRNMKIEKNGSNSYTVSSTLLNGLIVASFTLLIGLCASIITWWVAFSNGYHELQKDVGMIVQWKETVQYDKLPGAKEDFARVFERLDSIDRRLENLERTQENNHER